MKSRSASFSLGRRIDAPAIGGPTRATATAQRWLTTALAIGLAASISLSEIVLLALAVFVGPTPARRRLWPLAWPITLFAAWTVVSALVSARPRDSLLAARTLVWLAVIWVVLRALPDRVSVDRFVSVLFAAVTVVAALAIAQVALCPLVHEPTGLMRWFFHKCTRARGFFSIYMTLAGVLTVVLVLSLPAVASAGRRRWWMIAAWTIGLVALGVTYVRGAWLGFAAGAVGCTMALRRRMTVLALIALVSVTVIATLPGVRNRALTIGRVADDTTRDRLAMLHGGWTMVREHPIAGVGIGQVKRLYPSYAPPEALRHSTSHLHNTPLQILVERGAVGLVLWLTIYAAFFVAARRALASIPATEARDRGLVIGAIAAVAAFLVAGLFEYNFGDTEVILVTNALMALPFVLERDVEATVGQPSDVTVN